LAVCGLAGEGWTLVVNGLLGTKQRMGRIVDDTGAVVATTILSLGPCYVTQLKTTDHDGYDAIQIGYGEVRKLTKPKAGHLRGTASLPLLRHLREVKRDGDDVEVGQRIDASMFTAGERVDVTAVSKGRGFAGVMKRHGFHGGPKTHGQSDRWRAPGSIGAGTTPGRVLKGTRMAGRMGAERVTVKNLQVLAVDVERNLVALKGAVPGPSGGLVLVRRVASRQEAE
jgi:large subunit ribosomal protein L3